MLEKVIRVVVSGLAVGSLAATPETGSDLLAPERLERVNVAAEAALYRGKAAVRLVEAPGVTGDAETLAVVPGARLRQLRRNHTTQSISHPDHPWHRLRKESPGVYESYVDLVPGEWTRVKIVVSGTEARLFVRGAEQPGLIVKDLKLGASEGAVALWIGPGSEAHFAGLRVEPR